jgi:hypothetical protein
LTPKAEAGNPDAQLALGTLYQYGGAGNAGSAHPDYAAAAYWYQEAVKKDSAEAAYALGVLYHEGLGVQKDELSSMQLFTKAAQAGNIAAMTGLGNFYLMQDQTERIFWSAKPWLEKAAAAGSPLAYLDLGIFNYDEAVSVDEVFKKQYFDLSMNWYRRAADAGNCVAYMNIGGLYFNGEGVAQDRTQAQNWFAKAVNCKGELTPQLRQKAARFLQRSTNGPLPKVVVIEREPEAQVNAAGPQVDGATKLILGMAVLFAAAVVVDAELPRSPADSKKTRGDINRAQMEQEQDRQQQYQSCLAQYDSGARFGVGSFGSPCIMP